jgi:hypothetical protein
VLVSLDGDRAERVRQLAWSLDRDPTEVLDELVGYAQIQHEDVFYPRESFD